MKTIANRLLASLALLLAFFTLTGASSFFVQDNAHLINTDTKQIVEKKNAKYQKTTAHPIIIVETLKHAKKIQPDGLNKATRTVYIVINIGKDGNKRAYLYSSRDLHSQFTAQVRRNILSYTAGNISSDDSLAFNQGVQDLFQICTTLVDQGLDLKKDSQDLTNEELNHIIKPADLRIPIMVALGVVVLALITFLRHIAKQQGR